MENIMNEEQKKDLDIEINRISKEITDEMVKKANELIVQERKKFFKRQMIVLGTLTVVAVGLNIAVARGWLGKDVDVESITQ
jgi:hypothetical protein